MATHSGQFIALKVINALKETITMPHSEDFQDCLNSLVAATGLFLTKNHWDHSAGEPFFSDCLYNSFIIFVHENFLVMLWTENCN